jgi:hypothetical protein
MILRLVTFIIIFWSSTAFSQMNAVDRLLSAFENICVSSQFSEQATEAAVSALGRAWNVTVRPVPNERLVITPGVRRAWGLLGHGNDSLIIQIGERAIDGKRSQSCAIVAVNADFVGLRAALEKQFQVRKVTDAKQGLSDFTIYNATLIGYPNIVGIGVQNARDLRHPETFLTLSVFEVAGF